MGRGAFKANHSLGAELARDPKVQIILNDRAEEALVIARRIAREHRDTGAYEGSLSVEGNVLSTSDFAGHIIEFGGAKTLPLAPLRKAAAEVGAKVVDRG